MTFLQADDGRVVLRAAGEIDLLTAQDFEAALLAALDGQGDSWSTSTRVLHGLDRPAGAARGAAAGGGRPGGSLALRSADGSPVARLLDLAGVTRPLPPARSSGLEPTA